MSSGEEWANDDTDSPWWGCWLRLAPVALVLVALIALAACRTSPQTPPAPTTGVQPQPPVTAVVPSAVRVQP